MSYRRLPLRTHIWKDNEEVEIYVDLGYRISFLRGPSVIEGIVYGHEGLIIYCYDEEMQPRVLTLDQVVGSEKCSRDELLTHSYPDVRLLGQQ